MNVITAHTVCTHVNFDGATISNLPLCELSSMYEYVARVITDWPFSQAVIEKVDLDAEPAKEVVDLANLHNGLNWIILGKKTKPEVVSFV
jgi:hypothetical protein